MTNFYREEQLELCLEIMPKDCPNCGTRFSTKHSRHKFCCEKCKGEYKYKSGIVTTESQYFHISENWPRYLSRLLYSSGRKRDNLSRDILLSTLEKQDYLCALSGVPLTCILTKGTRHPTNATVDRIQAGGPYTPENIQLVCRALNCFRSDTNQSEFIEWCRKVTEFQNAKKS